MKHCYKKPQFNFYDAVAMECWFSDLAKKGLILNGHGLWNFRFAKKEPAYIRFRVEPLIDDNNTPSEDMVDIYKEAGWEFVTTYGGLFFVWKSSRSDATELHSDPIVQSESYSRLCKKLTKQAVVTCIAVLISIALILTVFSLNNRPITSLLINPFNFILIISQIFLVPQAVQQAICANRVRKILSNGFTLEHKKEYRKKHLGYLFYNIFSTFIAIAVLITSIMTFTNMWTKSVVDVEQELPFIPLDVLEQNEEFEWATPQIFHGEDFDFNNYVSFAWSILAPEYYEVFQKGAEQLYKFEDSSELYKPSARTEYYRMRFSFFSPLLLEELMEVHLWEGTEYTITELDLYDRAVLAEEETMKHLFAYEGTQLIYIRYFGYSDLRDSISLLDDIFKI